MSNNKNDKRDLDVAVSFLKGVLKMEKQEGRNNLDEVYIKLERLRKVGK